MRAAALRAEAATLRDLSEKAGERKAQLARDMLNASGALHESLTYEQGVADCMMRRYRQWADQLELAAREIEEP